MKNFLSAALFGLFLVAAVALPQNAQAQIHELKQTVFGMDCAPCAHALEGRLGKIDGVSDVDVSLDEGFARLELRPENQVTLEAIRDAIKESGFAAKDATIRVSGILEYTNGNLVLVSMAGDRFVLEQGDEGGAEYRRLQDAPSGRQVVVTGFIPEGADPEHGRWVLQVLDARS